MLEEETDEGFTSTRPDLEEEEEVATTEDEDWATELEEDIDAGVDPVEEEKTEGFQEMPQTSPEVEEEAGTPVDVEERPG